MPSSALSGRPLRRPWAVPLLALLLSLLLPGLAARAATLTVTNTNDAGAGSLRAQVAAAQSSDTITFDPSVTGTITLTSGEIAFGQGLTIVGPGASVLAVSGGGSSRVFEITGGTVSISGLTIENGIATSGGGLLIDDGAVTLTSCVLSGNMANDGGAVENDGVLSGDSLTLNACTLSGNAAMDLTGGGGGLANTGGAALTNCTVSGNSSMFEGGGVASSGLVRLTNCTVSGNSAASSDGGLYNDPSTGTAFIISTILDGNTVNGTADDVDEAVTSDGSNLVGADTSGSFIQAYDQTGVANPMLGPLQNNSGPNTTVLNQTPTQALLFGSPAIDADYDHAVNVDQIGTARPQNARNDIGAFEYVNQPPVAKPDRYSVATGVTLTVNAPGVLANDVDKQGEALTAVLVSTTSNGQLTLNSDGSFTYTANAGYIGTDSFTYKARAADGDSNTTTVSIINTSQPDTTAPTTTATPSPATPNGTNGWYTGSVSVTLSATDPDDSAGNITTYYTTDGSTPTVSSPVYSQPIVLSGDGTHALKFFSQDLAGNAENAQTLTIQIDGTPPTLTFGTPTPAPGPNSGGYVNGPVSIPYTTSDATSGVASSAPGSPVQFTTEGANQTQTVTVTDVAGNSVQFTTPSVSIDLTPPVTTGANQSAPGGQQVTLSPTDNLSGVGSTVYSLDGGTAQAYTAPFTVQINGPHTVTFHSVDKAGNVESDQTLNFTVNNQAPITTDALSGPQGQNGWYKGTVTVTLTAQSRGLPVATTYYTIDGGARQTYSQPFSVSGDAAHAITFDSVDTGGNQEPPNQQTIKIDDTAPTLTFGTPSPAPNASGYVNSPVDVPYTAGDATSGVATVSPASPAHFGSEGANQTQTITVTDIAGNTRTFTSPPIGIDLTKPVTTGSTSSGPAGTRVTLVPTDNLSGVASTVYSLDGGPQTAYSRPFTVAANGSHTLTFHSVDNAGNVESDQTLNFTVNNAGPHTTAALSGPRGLNGWYLGTVTVTLSATAGGAPVQQTVYAIDGGTQQTYTGPFPVSGDAVHTVTFHSVDTAGNAESQNQQAIKIDATAPTLTFGFPTPAPNAAGWNNTPVSLPYVGADATSGYAGGIPGSPVQFKAEGKNQTQTVTAQDVAGNVLQRATPAVSIDLTAPVTVGRVSGTTVTLTASDNLSGVALTQYALDGGTPQPYTTPFTITGVGSHTVTFHSADIAGNVEANHSLTVAGPPPGPKVLHTFSAGLQMIAVPEDYSKVGLGNAWDASSAVLAVWDSTLVQYVLTPQSPADGLRPGQGYWVRLHNTTNLFDVGVPTPTNAPFTINLAHGWNMIGDPFLSGVALSGATVLNGAGKSLNLTDANHAGLIYTVFYSYPSGASQYQTTGADGSLTPYTGYWVYAFRACRLVLPAPG